MAEEIGSRRPAGELEARALASLWEAGRPLTPGELRRRLGDGLARTTVSTILIRLYDKGVVRRSPSGRGFAYEPAADASGLTARRMHAELDRGQDRTSVLARFVGDLSDEDGETLRALLSGMGDSLGDSLGNSLGDTEK
ncbi:BlaI/MecI/CopY family transcriptional regulator [Streptomyces sp. NPDC088785]|uniref:BlaI/MecI/CopY family transcriptional regulator n=1 Tax=Streptomyces sp. NPDC088785 TaxID=3365897 RepID=UPI00380DEFA1